MSSEPIKEHEMPGDKNHANNSISLESLINSPPTTTLTHGLDENSLVDMIDNWPQLSQTSSTQTVYWANALLNHWVKLQGFADKTCVLNAGFIHPNDEREFVARLIRSQAIRPVVFSSGFLANIMSMVMLHATYYPGEQINNYLSEFFEEKTLDKSHKMASLNHAFSQLGSNFRRLTHLAGVKNFLKCLDIQAANEVESVNLWFEQPTMNDARDIIRQTIRLRYKLEARDAIWDELESFRKTPVLLVEKVAMLSDEKARVLLTLAYQYGVDLTLDDALHTNLLMNAILMQSPERIVQLSSYGVVLTDKQRTFLEQLLSFSLLHDARLFKRLCGADINLNVNTSVKYSVMLLALLLGKSEEIESLNQMGACLDSQLLGQLSRVIATVAVSQRMAVIKQLLLLDIDFTAFNSLEQTPFIAALAANQYDNCQLLLKRHSLTSNEQQLLEKKFLQLIQVDNRHMLEFLTPLIKKCSSRTAQGYQAIVLAALNGNASLVETLKPLSVLDDEDRVFMGKALLQAVQANKQEAVDALLSLEPDLSIRGEEGSLLSIALKHHNQPIISSLLNAKIRLSEDDKALSGQLFDDALTRGHCSVVEQLLQAGAPVSYFDSEQETALYKTFVKANGPITTLLMQQGAELESPEKTKLAGRLFEALKQGDENAFNLLGKAGVRLLATQKPHIQTLLFNVVEQRKPEHAEFIINKAYGGRLDENLGCQLVKQIASKGDGNLLTALLKKINPHPELAQRFLRLIVEQAKQHPDLLKQLISQIPFANISQEMLTDLFVASAEKGDAGQVQSLLKAGVTPDCRTSLGKTALQTAAEHKHLEVTESLLKWGGETVSEHQSKERGLLMLQAIARKQPDLVSVFLSHGANVNLTDAKGHSGIFTAMQVNSDDIKERLLKAGATINKQDTVALEKDLMKGINANDCPAVKALFDLGLKIPSCPAVTPEVVKHVINQSHFSMLNLLTQAGFSLQRLGGDYLGQSVLTHGESLTNDLLEQFIEAGAILTLRDKQGNTALIQALLRADEARVATLLKHSKGIPELDRKRISDELIKAIRVERADIEQAILLTGITPYALLLEAINENKQERAYLLINHGVDLARVDEQGHSLLYHALCLKHDAISNLLLKAKASINSVDREALNDLLLDGIKTNDVALVKHLIEAGLEVKDNKHCDKEFVNSLIKHNQFGMLELLLQGGLVMQEVDSQLLGYSLLQNMGSLSPNLVEKLMASGADINSRNSFGETPLIKAAMQGDNKMVVSLLKAGAIISDEDQELLGRELILAIKFERKEVIQSLVQANASLESKDSEGNTALIIAIDKKKFSLIRLLINRGAKLMNAVQVAVDEGQGPSIKQSLAIDEQLIDESIRPAYHRLLEYLHAHQLSEDSSKAFRHMLLRQSLVFLMGLKLLGWQDHTQYLVVSEIEALCRENETIIKSPGLFGSDEFQAQVESFLATLSAKSNAVD